MLPGGYHRLTPKLAPGNVEMKEREVKEGFKKKKKRIQKYWSVLRVLPLIVTL